MQRWVSERVPDSVAATDMKRSFRGTFASLGSGSRPSKPECTRCQAAALTAVESMARCSFRSAGKRLQRQPYQQPMLIVASAAFLIKTLRYFLSHDFPRFISLDSTPVTPETQIMTNSGQGAFHFSIHSSYYNFSLRAVRWQLLVLL